MQHVRADTLAVSERRALKEGLVVSLHLDPTVKCESKLNVRTILKIHSLSYKYIFGWIWYKLVEFKSVVEHLRSTNKILYIWN